MTNKEKFTKNLIDIYLKGFDVALNKDGIPVACGPLRCKECLFRKSTKSCLLSVKEWAEQEYVEPKPFTEEEKALLRALPKVKWVARDKSGNVYLFMSKPFKNYILWDSMDGNYLHLGRLNIFLDNKVTFNSIKWEDAEPTSRDEILKIQL